MRTERSRRNLPFALLSPALLLAAGCSGGAPAHTIENAPAGGAPTLPRTQIAEDILNPVQSNVTISGVFRQAVRGVKTQTAVAVPATTFFATAAAGGTIETMATAGYTLVDVDIDTSTGSRVYTGVFQSGVPSTQYWEYTEGDFGSKVVALEGEGINLISLKTYTSGGQLFYSGVFQARSGVQEFVGAMTPALFAEYNTLFTSYGYGLTNVAVFSSSGEETYAASWVSTAEGAVVSSPSGWNAFAKQLLTQGAAGMRLSSMAHWEWNGNRQYVGVWVPGLDLYDAVGATDAAVFNRKVNELAISDKVPIQINIEHGYQPPPGLAAAFNDQLDSKAIGYSYAISEEGSTTATGAFGFARAPFETVAPPSIPMSPTTRLDVGSTTKAVAAVAFWKLIEEPLKYPTVTVNTPIMEVFNAPGAVLYGNSSTPVPPNISTVGEGVAQVTINDLLNMDSGIYDPAACTSMNEYNYLGELTCALENFTRVGPALPGAGGDLYLGPPPYESFYSDVDFGVLRGVVEVLAGMPFETYVNDYLFQPTGVQPVPNDPLALTNGNCYSDLTTSTRPLYYSVNQTSSGGVDEYTRPTLLRVCGTGGMQLTSPQWNTFLMALMGGQVLNSNDLDTILTSEWWFQPVETYVGLAHAKNGGWTNGAAQGASADIMVFPTIETQVVVESNTGALDDQTPIWTGIDQMYSYPLGTFAIANVNNAAFGNMCLTVSGNDFVDNQNIVQWTCVSPLPQNQLFVKLAVGSLQTGYGPNQFMLEAGSTSSGMCLTVESNSSTPLTPMILYSCVGASNQVFSFVPTNGQYGYIAAANSGLCLEVSGGSIYSGVNIVEDTCNGSASQQFAFLP